MNYILHMMINMHDFKLFCSKIYLSSNSIFMRILEVFLSIVVIKVGRK